MMPPFSRGSRRLKLRGYAITIEQRRPLSQGRNRFFRVSEEVQDALNTGKPVVALETTIYTHGYPYPENISLSSHLESLVRVNGGIPATIGVINGVAHVGMQPEQLIELVSTAGSQDTWKLSRRDLGFIGGLGLRGQKLNGGTTIAGTMILAHLAGIKIFATGGLGGVHRDGENSMDISADLTELGRTPVAVISSGCKSFLDIGRTLEYLETQGVGVGTFADGRQGEVDFPAFWARDSGIKSPQVIKHEADAAAIVYAQSQFPVHSGLLFANPAPKEHEIPRSEIDNIIASAVEEAKWNGIEGNANTPYILKRIREMTDGGTVTANTALVEANVVRGTKVAVELAKLELMGGAALERDATTPAIVNSGVPEPKNRPNGGAEYGSPQVAPTDILVAGSLASDTMCDYAPFSTSTPSKEPVLETSNPSVISQSAGGVGRNVAVAAHLAGAKVALASAVAKDVAGLSLLNQLQHSGLSTSYVHQLELASGARTAQYVAVNDTKKDLVLAMADMSILGRPELESEKLWEECISTSEPQWLVADGNWSPAILSTIIRAARLNKIPVAFEPVSTAKAVRLFDKRHPSIKFSHAIPNHVVNLTTPNALELHAMHAAAREAGYFESEQWWKVIDALTMSSADSRERLVSIASGELVQQGVPQQCIQLLPYIPNIIVKLGPKGSLLVQLLSPGDSRLRDPDFASYILTRNLDDEVVVGGVYMRLFPAAKLVADDDVISVNGVGDTMLGATMAGLVKGLQLDQIIPVAQEAAVLTLKSSEAVSPDVRLLQQRLK